MIDNTAERDIKNFSKTDDVRQWLVEHGFISEQAESYQIAVVDDWDRPGSESYVMHFSVSETARDGSLSRQDFISKACIKVPSAETMQEWLLRREMLNEVGLSTPRLFATERAALIEEFIPYTFKEAFSNASDDDRKTMLSELVTAYDTLVQNGFHPRIMNDLRSRGTDVVFVDFGEDLGGKFNDKIPVHGREDILRQTLGKLGISSL